VEEEEEERRMARQGRRWIRESWVVTHSTDLSIRSSQSVAGAGKGDKAGRVMRRDCSEERPC